LIRLVIIAVLAFVLYKLLKGVLGMGRQPPPRPGGEVDEMVQDPYCGTYIPSREAVRRRIDGEDLYFCSEECASKYMKERRRGE
jgi:YHS domain-containing protein